MSASALLKLQSAGFTMDQVSALADLIDTQAASKTDLLEVEHRIATKLGDVRAELKTDLAKQDGKLVLLQWMMGFVLALLVALLGLVGRLFLH
mgnify:CR=1 FL=1